MLGIGEWIKLVPKDPRANCEYRLKLLEACESSPRLRQRVIEACRDDILFYVNTFCYFQNPLAEAGKMVGPFITWPFQDHAITATLQQWVVHRKDALWEKSREMGATWMALIIQDWCCLFHRHQKFLDISHSKDAVDNGPSDSDTLFWKIQFMHDHLPGWLLRDAQKPKKMNLDYPRTQSAITGAASTGRSGVGGRGKVLLDELGKQTQAYDIVGQTADTGPRLFISTHYGVGTTFYDLCQRPDLWKLQFHWSHHPEKNKGLYRWNTEDKKIEFLNDKYEVIEKSDFAYQEDYPFVCDGSPTGGPFAGIRGEWYDRECVRRSNKRDVAMHLDINAQGSDAQFFDGIVLRQLTMAHCMDPVWEGELHYDKQTGTPIDLVKVEGGPLKLWRLPDHQGRFPKSKYGAGADLSTGSGATNTCMTVGDAQTCEKILEYANPHIGGEEFAPLAIAICKMFKSDHNEGALLAWEQQGPGIKFGARVLQLGYRGIYFRRDEMPHTLTPTYSDRPGWNASPGNFYDLLVDYRSGLQSKLFINRSRMALQECANFRYTAQRQGVEHAGAATAVDPEAARENHGDRVIADALCYKMLLQLGLAQIQQELKENVVVGGWLWRRQLAEEQMRRQLMDDEDAA